MIVNDKVAASVKGNHNVATGAKSPSGPPPDGVEQITVRNEPQSHVRVLRTAGVAHPPAAPLFAVEAGPPLAGAIQTSEH